MTKYNIILKEELKEEDIIFTGTEGQIKEYLQNNRHLYDWIEENFDEEYPAPYKIEQVEEIIEHDIAELDIDFDYWYLKIEEA